jgi:O-antigen ligase
MWWIPQGAKYVPGIVIVSLLILAAGRRFMITMTNHSSPLDSFVKVLWLYVGYVALVYVVHGGSWSELRALLCLALYLQFVRRIRLPDSWRIGLLMASSLALTVLVFSEYLQYGGRVGGHINPIPFATVIGVLFLALYAWVLFACKKLRIKIIASFLILALLVSLMMTQTRGVLIPVLVAVVALPLLYGLKQPGVRSRKIILALLVVLLTAGSGLAIINSDRIVQTIDEVEAVSSGDLSTSVGIRLQLWRSAIPLIADAPLMGHGDGYRDALEELHHEGELSAELYHFNAAHFHNQFLDTWVKKGALGLGIFVATLLAAIKAFWSAGMVLWRRVAGVSIVLLLSVSALTDVPLLHVPVIFYAGFLLSILAADRTQHSDWRVVN